MITPEIRYRLWSYMGGILRAMHAPARAIGGTGDHLHPLMSLPSTLSTVMVLRVVKGGSTRWIHDPFPSAWRFAWQEGYGAFSIGGRDAHDLVAYILDQEAHHRVQTYQEEFLRLLAVNDLDYDECYIRG